jgi:pyruvate dehydrogenase E2 component (dihydrolipoamide acetyltransferase)
MPNVELEPIELTTWRKIALGSWRTAGDPSVYGTLELNAAKIEEHRKRFAERTGTKAPTITAIVAAATAAVLRDNPQINGLIRWGRIYKRKSVTLFLQTAVDDEGKELSGVTIRDAEHKALPPSTRRCRTSSASCSRRRRRSARATIPASRRPRTPSSGSRRG